MENTGLPREIWGVIVDYCMSPCNEGSLRWRNIECSYVAATCSLFLHRGAQELKKRLFTPTEIELIAAQLPILLPLIKRIWARDLDPKAPILNRLRGPIEVFKMIHGEEHDFDEEGAWGATLKAMGRAKEIEVVSRSGLMGVLLLSNNNITRLPNVKKIRLTIEPNHMTLVSWSSCLYHRLKGLIGRLDRPLIVSIGPPVATHYFHINILDVDADKDFMDIYSKISATIGAPTIEYYCVTFIL